MSRLRRWLVRAVARTLGWLIDTAGTGAVPWGPDGVNGPAWKTHTYTLSAKEAEDLGIAKGVPFDHKPEDDD